MNTLPTPVLRVQLQAGAHTTPDKGLCVMECVAYVMGEDHTYNPRCACPVVSTFAAYVNDNYLDVHADALLQRVFRLAGSRKSDEVTGARAYFLFDYLLRTVIPAALRNTKMQKAPLEQADAFAALPQVEIPAQFPAVRAAAAKLKRYGHKIPALLAERIGYLVELLEMPAPPKMPTIAIIGALQLLSSKDGVAEGHGFKAVSLDVLGVLDSLLDIGDTKAVPVTPEVAARIAGLSKLVEPAAAVD